MLIKIIKLNIIKIVSDVNYYLKLLAILSFRNRKALMHLKKILKEDFGKLLVYYHLKSRKTREMKFAIPLNITPYDAK